MTQDLKNGSFLPTSVKVIVRLIAQGLINARRRLPAAGHPFPCGAVIASKFFPLTLEDRAMASGPLSFGEEAGKASN